MAVRPPGPPDFPRRSRPLALALLLAALAAPAPGQEEGGRDLTDLSLEELMNVEVTSVSKREQALGEAAAAVAVLTREEIRRSGAQSLPEALRLVPGLEVATIDGNKWAISARGFNLRFANKMLVLVDGRSVYTPLFSGVYWDVQDTLLEDVERIEVIRGPGATLWGANAVNGVINVITRGARETPGLLATFGAGNEERANASARFGGSPAERVHARAFVKGFSRDERRFPGGGRAADDWRLGRGGFRVDWEGDDAGRATLQGDLYRGEEGQTQTAVTRLAPPFVERFDEDVEVWGGNLLGRWSRRFSDGAELTAQAYYDRTGRSGRLHGETRDTADLDLQQRLRLGRHEIVFGAGYRFTDDEVDNTFTIRLEPRSRSTDLWSAFVQDEVALLDRRLRVTLGTKLEHNDYSGLELQPSARLLWRAGGGASLWGAVSRAARTPSRAESDIRYRLSAMPGGPAGVTEVVLFGSPAFDSEELLAWEAGARFQADPRLSFDLALFLNDYDDLRTVEPGAPELAVDPFPHVVAPLVFANRMRGRAAGGELQVRWEPHRRLRVRGGYSLLDLDLELEPGSGDSTSAEGDSPRHQLRLHALLDLPGRVELDGLLCAVDDVPSQEVDAHARLDLRLGWRATPSLDLDLVLQNLLDDGHREFGSVLGEVPTEVERSAHARVTVRF